MKPTDLLNNINEIGQSENMVALQRNQKAQTENQKVLSQGLAGARLDNSRLMAGRREAEEKTEDLMLETALLEEENKQLKDITQKARNILYEMALRNEAFKKTIDHLKSSWGSEKANQIDSIHAQIDTEVRNDGSIKERFERNIIKQTTPKSK